MGTKNGQSTNASKASAVRVKVELSIEALKISRALLDRAEKVPGAPRLLDATQRHKSDGSKKR